MIKSFKVKLKVNNKQRTQLFKCAGVSRFAYNWALEQEKINYEAGNKFISNYDLRKKLTQLKKTDEFSWLFDYDNNITKQAIKDACDSFLKFFKGRISCFATTNCHKLTVTVGYGTPITIRYRVAWFKRYTIYRFGNYTTRA